MADDLIRYDLLVQDALRNVVRKVLGDAARDGLAGEHHFYVSFRTDYPGVRISQRLREKYPQDMTIVLQHQFWDLGVTEHTFEVGLSFSGVPAIGSNLPKIVPAAKAEAKPAAKEASAKDEAAAEPKADEAGERTDAPQEGASVVSLDAFRKKS
jgi:hypothetical protein